MRTFKKIIKGFLTAILPVCFTFGGCGISSSQSEEEETENPNLVSENSVVKSVREVGSITGRKSAWNDTITGAGVGGTDLGIPVYDSKNNRMMIFFGDTFSGQTAGAGSGFNDWRSNVCAYSTDFDLSDGLKLDGWVTKEGRELAKQMIPSSKTDNYEMTTIPTGAVELNGTIYTFYMSVRHWGANGEWWVNYCGLMKSTDGGENYSRVEDVYFTGIKDETTMNLMNLDSASVKDHYAPGFSQVWPMISGEYVYLYGIEGGRFGAVQLARVKQEDFESFDKYEYYVGKDAEGKPKFVIGNEGRKIVAAEDRSATYVMGAPAGEMCVVYNAYLKKYITIYQVNQIMVFRSSETPWGEWSEPITLLGYDNYHAMYCGFMHEKYMEQDGKVVYFIMSYWWDYESILMRLELY